jgi:hypothetical protein
MDREKICTRWGDAAYTVEYILVVPGPGLVPALEMSDITLAPQKGHAMRGRRRLSAYAGLEEEEDAMDDWRCGAFAMNPRYGCRRSSNK